jgi:hypothetical protein
VKTKGKDIVKTKGKRQGEIEKGRQRETEGSWMISSGWSEVDTKCCFKFRTKSNYSYLLDVIIAIIATLLAKVIIAIPDCR